VAGAVLFGAALAALSHRVVALPEVDRIALVLTVLLLARGLAGRRRVAREVALVLVGIAALVPPYRLGRLLVLVGIAAVLLAYPGNYVVRPDPRRLRTASAAAAIAVFVVLARGVWMAVRHGDPVRQAAHAALPLLPAAPDRSTRAFVVAVFAATLVALAVAMSAAPPPPPGGPAERARVRALAQDPEAGSLAPFASRADKTYVFSPDGAAVIGYRVRFGVALAGGDPVGAAESAGGAVQAFADLCAVRGWRPAVLGAASAAGALWRRAGVRRGLEIGAEAVLDVATFSLAARRMRNVRQAAQRAQNAGLRVTIGPLEPALVPRLAPILRDWLHGRAERGFAMNLDHVLTPRDDVLVAVAYDPAGEPRAFARFALVAGGRVLSLDVAPRGRGAPNGVVERLIVEMVGYGRAHGAREVSLNFAGMRRVYAGHTVVARLAQVPLAALDRWIELRSLYRFTAKFHPLWRPRELRMRSWLDILPVGAAALTAEFGQRQPVTAMATETAEGPAISGA
jgi:lysyl-tRNA synthetase class 2